MRLAAAGDRRCDTDVADQEQHVGAVGEQRLMPSVAHAIASVSKLRPALVGLQHVASPESRRPGRVDHRSASPRRRAGSCLRPCPASMDHLGGSPTARPFCLYESSSATHSPDDSGAGRRGDPPRLRPNRFSSSFVEFDFRQRDEARGIPRCGSVHAMELRWLRSAGSETAPGRSALGTAS